MERLTSIIILSYNTCRLLKECIESIRRYTRPNTYEIIVVDNASSDDSVEWLSRQNDVRLIANETNNGFPGGCNQGLRVAHGTELLLLNSDTLVTVYWLDNMLRALYSDKKVGAVGCMTNTCSNLQKVDVTYGDADEMQSFAEKYNRSNRFLWIPWYKLVGFCLLFKREVLERVGYLDEVFSPGNYEDDDYSLRIHLAGYELLLCKDTFIHHYGNASFVQGRHVQDMVRKSVEYNDFLSRNENLFVQKWGLDSASWNKIDIFTTKIVELADDHARLLVMDVRCTMDLYFLSDKRPDLQLMGISTNKTATNAMGISFSMAYGEDLSIALECVDDDFDGVAIMEPLKNAVLEGSIFRACLQKISNRRGKMFFTDGKKVYALDFEDLLELLYKEG